MSENSIPASATAPSNEILQRLLERLYNSLVSGPSLNCRPHTSRQRLDLTALARFADLDPAAILPALLGTGKRAEIMARTPAYRGPMGDDVEITDEQRATKRASDDQNRLLAKLRDIAEDARDYEQDHGESALYIGYPLLHLPAGGAGGSRRTAGSRRSRILAPLALLPVEMAVRRGPGTPSVTFKARGNGADLLVPNLALLAWIEQQTGKDSSGLFADEAGEDPFQEINELLRFAAENLRLPMPEPFTAETPLQPASRGDSDRPLVNTSESDRENVAGETEASFVPAAVLGLFPVSNQGLLRDVKAMAAGQTPLDGPVASFLTVDLEAGTPTAATSEQADAVKLVPTRNVVDPGQQRLVSNADPCQVRAVRLARECPALVVHGPPGTGKSQTITNMIGDHLARGQRVLLVCDKRTALDVVRYRLDALGLGSLCAVVHDAQHDQRALYKKLRDTLEGLADNQTTAAVTENDLGTLDADLVRLHAELGAYHHSLHEPPAEGDASFHELVGRWLALPDAPADLGIDHDSIGALTLEELQSGHADLTELLERARKIHYAENLWVEAAGLSLADYLAQPLATWRQRLAALTHAARQIDAESPGGGLPGLDADDIASLTSQAELRSWLAERLESLAALPGIGAAAARWGSQSREAIQLARTGFGGMDDSLRQIGTAPLDPALLAAGAVSSLAETNRALATLRDYEAACGHWYAGVYNPHKKPAQALLAGYGLPTDPTASERVRAFLEGVAARTVARDFLRRALGDGAVEAIPRHDDAALAQTFGTHQAVLQFLDKLLVDQRFASVLAQMVASLPEPIHARQFAGALRQSARRAQALAAFDEMARHAALFSGPWLDVQETGWRNGDALAATFVSLESLLPTLENVLRVHQTFAILPVTLHGPAGSLIWRHSEPDVALPALHRAVLTREIGQRMAGSTTLQNVDTDRINALFMRYAQLSTRKRELVRDLILARWQKRQRDRLLSSTRTQLNSAGAALKRRLVTRGERAVKLRQVIAQGTATEGGDPLFDLCPVWMASPGTVAQIFPREALFDCVIFDEASQCRLEEALPVLLRAKRVVVAGDPKQLPPTRFFEGALTESENVEAETDQELFEQQQGETEDLLSAALNIQVQQSYLDVHYRSRNEALIGFSNENFYDRRLQAIPGHPKNRAKACPVRLVRVDGTYEKRANHKEAEAVVALVKELLAQPEPPSVGVACFNLTQRQLVLDLLDEAALADQEFASRLAAARVRRGAGSFEGLFVKNLENVQGDERDHMIISTTFGADPKGKFRRNFGPLGRAGGGRRLNVLVTRARDMVHVMTSIPRGEYAALAAVPDGEQPGGRWLLYAYLRYAEELAEEFERDRERVAQLAAARRVGEVRVRPSETGSLLAQALAKRLSPDGLSSDVHWGNEGFGIDLALRHPIEAEMVTAGVLCDMTRFKQVEDPVEWELFRLGVHLAQGWHLHRVWSPAIFRDLERVLQEIMVAAKAAQENGDKKTGVAHPVTERTTTPTSPEETPERP